PPNQTSFYAGTLQFNHFLVNLDARREFEIGLSGPLNVAVGTELRRENYQIGAGEPASYAAGYVDLEGNVVGRLRLGLAGRYEHYSDFGSTADGKVTLRFEPVKHLIL